MSNIKHFGAVGDGRADDRAAILHAIENSDGAVTFPRGVYRIHETIEIDLEKRGPICLHGTGGTARLVMAGPGPAIRLVGHHGGTADPPSLSPVTWERERCPQLLSLEITGDHPEADGVELVRTMQPTLKGMLIRRVRHALRLRERNRNLLVDACHIYHNTGFGIFIDRCNLHQGIVSASHISYNQLAGIHAVESDLHNFQIVGNDIEYNHANDTSSGAAEIWFETLGEKASEITIVGNTIQSVPTPGGANVRVRGLAQSPPTAAPLITITGNVLGSQETNVDLAFVNRLVISANTLYDGRLVTIVARDCRNLVISGNTLGWTHAAERKVQGGILLERCQVVNITGLTLEDDGGGSEQDGGSITLVECADSAVQGCQILDPRWRGIALRDCVRTRVSDNTIVDRRAETHMLSAIASKGGADNLIQNNLVRPGRLHAILAEGGTAIVQGNVEAATKRGAR